MTRVKHTEVIVISQPVVELARAKRLPAGWLAGEEIGLFDRGGGAVGIPYRDEAGLTLFVRQRNPEGAEPRFFQPKGIGLVPYGLWRLDQARRHASLAICEGESDTWVLWHHGLPALGLPGSMSCAALEVEHLIGIERLWVVPDRDLAGEQFVRGLAARLAELRYPGEVWVLALPGPGKDLCDHHAADPSAFAECWVGWLEHAERLVPLPPASGRHQDNGRPAGSAAPPPPAQFRHPIPASQLARQDDARKWIWHGILGRGEVTLFSAYWKAGKSTLLAHLFHALRAGGPGLFLDFRVQPSRVLVVTEETQDRWARRRDLLGLGDHVHFMIRPFLCKAAWPDWLAFLSHLRSLQGAEPYDLLVMDTLSNLWPVDRENDAGQVQQSLQPLHDLGDDLSLLLVHHLRKGDGTEATGSRGSGVIPAFGDTILELRRFIPGDRKDRRRVLTAYGRDDDTLDELVVELAEDGQSYATHGDRQQVRADGLQRGILERLPGEPPGLTADEVLSGWPEESRPHRNEFYRALAGGADAGLWQRQGEGKRGSPRRFWRGASEVSGFGTDVLVEESTEILPRLVHGEPIPD
jgi:hypothetical protein